LKPLVNKKTPFRARESGDKESGKNGFFWRRPVLKWTKTQKPEGHGMATEKLYYEDSHLRRFAARVLSCRPGGHGWDVELDRTAFYPEGGGQPGDTGTLGGVRVTDTHEREGRIVHWCEAPLPEGAEVAGEIDWERRFDLMQQHSGEHIVSGLVHAAFGWDNVGFHMGADMVTIDFSGPITEEQLREIERKANEKVWENLPYVVTWPSEEELGSIPYRSKKELTGPVRIVTVPGVDICACCGTHVSSTGEVGLIKIFSSQKFHEGVRLELLCGRRAYEHASALIEQNHENSGLLSARPLETAASVRRLLDEHAALKQRAAQLETESFRARAEKLAGAGDCLVFEPGLDPDGVRRLADAVLSVCGGVAAVFSGADGEGYRYAVGRAGGDVRALVKELNAALSGRGGGKPFFAQGSVQASRAQIETFWKGRRA
jgi:alanyl-tRNA synthetase